jgi:bile acid-coenzyme A ligase
LGETVLALVNAERHVSEHELLSHLERHLSRCKLPAAFEFVSESLRNEAGKVCRQKLRQARLVGRQPTQTAA